MASDSEHDDVEPGSDAYRILSAIKRTPTRPSQAKSQLFSPQPGSLEAALASEGLNAPLSTLEHEEALRDQASKAVEHRQLEIEAYHAALHDALGELQRVRAAEEARLAGRVASSRQRFESRLEELQRSFADEVERLKRQAVAELHKQRHHSEAAIAARVRDLQGQLMFLPHHPSPHLTHNYQQQQQQQHRRGVGTPSRSPGAAVSYRHTGSPMQTGGRAGSAGGALRPGTAGSSWGLGSWGSGVGAGGEQHGVGASALLRRQQRSPVRVLWRGEDARPGEREAGGGRKGASPVIRMRSSPGARAGSPGRGAVAFWE